MNRIALKQFAVRARAELLQSIGQEDPVQGEETAYSWFIRFAVLRFMECNALLPEDTPVFTDENGDFLPEEQEAGFRERLSSLCRTLGSLPAFSPLFSEHADLKILHLPLLRQEGMLAQLLEISREDWTGHPELIGWLHQYYHTRQKETAFSQLRRNIKIAPELIPAATQTFTPDWIIRYMAENTLVTLWNAMHPGRTAPGTCRFYLPETEQPAEAEERLSVLHSSLNGKSVTELTIMDPCMGTGHILVHVFDLLMGMYRAEGFAPAEAARSILRKNLYGLDIDSRAAGLARLILVLKACRYDPAILREPVRLHLAHFSGLSLEERTYSREEERLAESFSGCESFGSLLRPLPAQPEDSVSGDALSRMRCLSAMLNRKYDAVITNPPYMGSSNMHPALAAFVRKHYPDSKSDLFAAFMERCGELTAPEGCFAMVTQHAWMFLSSYKALRGRMEAYTLRNMVHLGARAFSATDVGTIVQATAFVCMGSRIPSYRTVYLRLTDAEDKERAFFEPGRRYACSLERFRNIPGAPLCYWISDSILKVLTLPKLSEYCKICQGMTTSDNKRFLRYWFEVPKEQIAFGCRNAGEAMASGKRWFPYNKGGKCRKWYGNYLHVVNYYRNGEEMRRFHAELNRIRSGGRIKNTDMYFLPAVTWQFITEASRFNVRCVPEGFLFDVSGSSLFAKAEDRLYIMGFLSSCVARAILELYNPTMNFQVENLSSLPLCMEETCKPEINRLVSECIAMACRDWNQSELSWEFRLHPLAALRQKHSEESAVLLEQLFREWETDCRSAVASMRQNEETINRIFLRIYGLEQELSPEVPEAAVTLHRADRKEDLRSLISFGVGCLFGRYHMDGFSSDIQPGQLLTPEKAAACMENWLGWVFGEAALEENLRFLTSVLEEGGSPRERLTAYFARDFYQDHRRMYKHHPIYWLASSGTRRSFRGLMYLHGMEESPLPVILQHVDRKNALLQSERRSLTERMNASSQKSACAVLRKERTAVDAQLEELLAYRKRVLELQKQGAVLDPHAGVPANHSKFPGIFGALR